MKPGDIIFVRGRGFISRVIEWVTKSKYSHVALYMGNGQVFEAQRFRSAGFAPLSKYNGEYDVYTYSLTDEQRQRIVEFAKTMQGIHYDYLDIARLFVRCVFGLQLPYDDPTRIICSELIDKAYLAVGVRLVDREPYDITPEDLAESPKLQEVS